MKVVKVFGLGLDEAARKIVEHAPAKCDFYGFELRAKYATTNPRDVAEQYKRMLQLRAWSYWNMLPKEQRARMRCDLCGATDCKMWREYQTFADHTKVLCGPCALTDQDKAGPIDDDGKIESDLGKCDQIGWMVPAVPDLEGLGFWGYTSVPADAVLWWRQLPSNPKHAEAA